MTKYDYFIREVVRDLQMLEKELQDLGNNG